MSEYIRLLTKIRFHPTLWFVIGMAVLTAHFTEALMLFLVIFVHEMGHAVSAHYYRWRIKAIQLYPFGGVLDTEEYGNRSLKEDLVVTLAGPLQHLWLIGLAYLLYSTSFLSHEHYVSFLSMNIVLCLFNLMPIWPLDGGRLLFLTASLYRSFLQAQKLMLYISTVFALLLFMIWLIMEPLNLSVWMIALLIGFSIFIEWRQRYYGFIRFLLQRHYGHSTDLNKLKPIEADENEPIYKVLESFQRGCKHPIIVLKDGKERATLDETEILHAYFSEKNTNGKLGDLLYSY